MIESDKYSLSWWWLHSSGRCKYCASKGTPER